MGFSEKEPPFFFTKPADAVVENNATIPYPPITSDLHHEIELVLAIGKDGANISADDAMDHIWGVGVGIDFTRRDQQIAHREKGRPWCWGKAFDNSAPMTSLQPLSTLPPARQSLDSGRIWLSVNGDAPAGRFGGYDLECSRYHRLLQPVGDIKGRGFDHDRHPGRCGGGHRRGCADRRGRGCWKHKDNPFLSVTRQDAEG